MLVAFCSALAHPGSETGDIEQHPDYVVQSVWSVKGNDGPTTWSRRCRPTAGRK